MREGAAHQGLLTAARLTFSRLGTLRIPANSHNRKLPSCPSPDYHYMAVHPASLEILEKAAVPPAQARAIVQAIEIEIAGAKEILATKQDILILRHETAEMRTELRHEMTDLCRELRDGLEVIEVKVGSLVTPRQVYGTVFGAVLGQMTLLLGIAYFFVTHLQR